MTTNHARHFAHAFALIAALESEGLTAYEMSKVANKRTLVQKIVVLIRSFSTEQLSEQLLNLHRVGFEPNMFNHRVMTILRNESIDTLAHLTLYRESEFLEMRGLGANSIDVIKEGLDYLNICLLREDEDKVERAMHVYQDIRQAPFGIVARAVPAICAHRHFLEGEGISTLGDLTKYSRIVLLQLHRFADFYRRHPIFRDEDITLLSQELAKYGLCLAEDEQ